MGNRGGGNLCLQINHNNPKSLYIKPCKSLINSLVIAVIKSIFPLLKKVNTKSHSVKPV